MEQTRTKAPAAGTLFCALWLCIGINLHAATVRLLTGESYDGNKVQFVNNQILIMAQSGTTRVDLANVLDATFRNDRGPVEPGMLPPGALLTDGSLIAGNIGSLDDPIKLGDASIPLASVAWVIFQPFARDKISQPAAGQTGAIMPNGDFFQGTFAGIKDNRVAINSLLFGPQRFAIRGRADITALVLRGVQDGGARYEVVNRNGSVYLANEIKNDRDSIMIFNAIVGSVRMNNDALYEIRLAKNQYQCLAGLKPDRVDVPKGGDSSTALQIPPVAGDAPAANLQVAANAAVTYTVPKGFTVFSTGVTMPQGAPPGDRFTFAVYADGKFQLAKTTAGAGENGQAIRIPLANVHTIALRIEPAVPGDAATSGEWVQPMFMRQ